MISRDDIQKLAALARIKLEAEEAEKFTKEIDSILGYVADIQAFSGTGESRGSERVKNVLREDKDPHEPEIYTKRVLEEAPAREGDYVKVKKILS